MATNKPLQGYKVIDFSAVFAGPLCARYLQDCGAEVIKVEPPGVGDLVRQVDGITRVFGHFNAGKRSIAIDLKHPEGQQIARELIAQADILIENFRPGIMARFGLDYASLRQDHPELVYCSVSGFGQSGPWVDRAAYAPIVHAASGFDAVFAEAQGGADKRPPNWDIMMADILTGTMAFGAVQTALLSRLRTGGGEYIDISMMEAMMSLIPAHIQAVQMEEPAVIGNFCPVQTRDGFVMVCVVSNKNLQCLADALGRPELIDDPRFVRGPRTAHFNELAREIEKWSLGISSAECTAILNDAGVPCGVYEKPGDLFDHPQVLERESFTAIDHDRLGAFLIQNMPVRFVTADTAAASWVADLGQHTDEVLSGKLGRSAEAIAALRKAGAVA